MGLCVHDPALARVRDDEGAPGAVRDRSKMLNSSVLLAAASILLLPLFVPKWVLAATVVLGGVITWLLREHPTADQRRRSEPAPQASAPATDAAQDVTARAEPAQPGTAHLAAASGETVPSAEAPVQAAGLPDGTMKADQAQVTTALEAGAGAGAALEAGAGAGAAASATSETIDARPSPGPAPPADPVSVPASGPTPARAGGAAILAKLRAQRAAAKAVPQGPKKLPLVVLYGSQTGTAQEIAQNIGGRARELGISVKVHAAAWGPGG